MLCFFIDFSPFIFKGGYEHWGVRLHCRWKGNFPADCRYSLGLLPPVLLFFSFWGGFTWSPGCVWTAFMLKMRTGIILVGLRVKQRQGVQVCGEVRCFQNFFDMETPSLPPSTCGTWVGEDGTRAAVSKRRNSLASHDNGCHKTAINYKLMENHATVFLGGKHSSRVLSRIA